MISSLNKLLLTTAIAFSLSVIASSAWSQSKTNDPANSKTQKQSEPQDDSSSLKQALQSKLDNIVADEKFPGATLAVVSKDGTLLELSSGFADRNTKTRMPVGGRMFCGSTGKTFVSAVALKLIEKGKLELDEKAMAYFKGDDQEWFSMLPNAEEITIRSLLNHTSGLPRYLFQKEYLADLKAHPMQSRKPREGLAVLQGTKPVHAVGEGWSYSDSNYLVIGLIIEKVTGRKFYDVANDWLLTPLELADTIPTTKPALPGLVQGHIGSANMFDLPKKTVVDGKYVMNPDFEWCGGGYITTAGDLARWLHALHTDKVLSKQMYRNLIAPVDFKTGKRTQFKNGGYGLGSFVWSTELGIFYGHAGIMPGYLTQIEFSAKEGFAIALQTNTDEGLGRRHHDLVQEIAAIVVDNSPNKGRSDLEQMMLNKIREKKRQRDNEQRPNG